MDVRFTLPLFYSVLVLLLLVGQTAGGLLPSQEDESQGPDTETKNLGGGTLPSLEPPAAVSNGNDDRESERLDIELTKKHKLQIDHRDYREGKVYVLNRGKDLKLLPIVQCHGGEKDLLLAEDFSCSDAVQRRAGRDVRMYANKGNAYARRR